MGLYRYVEDRDELERLVVDHVLGAVDTSPPPPSPWPERLRVMVVRIRAAVGAHPAVVPLTVIHRQRSISGLRWSETVLGILTEAGFDGERRVIALRGLLSYVTGAIQLEHLGSLAGAGTVTIAALPRDQFPLMAETATAARQVPADAEFNGGLDLLLRGLAAIEP